MPRPKGRRFDYPPRPRRVFARHWVVRNIGQQASWLYASARLQQSARACHRLRSPRLPAGGGAQPTSAIGLADEGSKPNLDEMTRKAQKEQEEKIKKGGTHEIKTVEGGGIADGVPRYR